MREFNKEVMTLTNNARRIRDLSFIMNTILGNACYSDKEKEAQISKGERLGNLNEEELTLLNEGWELRNTLAKNLMQDLSTLIKKSKKDVI